MYRYIIPLGTALLSIFGSTTIPSTSQIQAAIAGIDWQATQLQTALQYAPDDLECRFTRDLFSGETGDDVFCLQYLLENDSDLAYSPTGYFGSMTTQAVKNWQAKNNVSPTGYFGPLSQAMYLSEHPDIPNRPYWLALSTSTASSTRK